MFEVCVRQAVLGINHVFLAVVSLLRAQILRVLQLRRLDESPVHIYLNIINLVCVSRQSRNFLKLGIDARVP
jgi:hypothetical protein